jgi:hypothetical protein
MIIITMNAYADKPKKEKIITIEQAEARLMAMRRMAPRVPLADGKQFLEICDELEARIEEARISREKDGATITRV